MKKVDELLKNNLFQKFDFLQTQENWQKIAGNKIAYNTFAYSYKYYKLYVSVPMQYLVQDLSFVKPQLLLRAKQIYPDIKDIHFKYMPQEQEKKVEIEDNTRLPKSYEIRIIENLSKNIHDENIRNAFQKAFLQYIKKKPLE